MCYLAIDRAIMPNWHIPVVEGEGNCQAQTLKCATWGSRTLSGLISLSLDKTRWPPVVKSSVCCFRVLFCFVFVFLLSPRFVGLAWRTDAKYERDRKYNKNNGQIQTVAPNDDSDATDLNVSTSTTRRTTSMALATTTSWSISGWLICLKKHIQTHIET